MHCDSSVGNFDGVKPYLWLKVEAVVSVLFGYIPARRAAKLNPIGACGMNERVG